jgi:hypothetical protein
MKRRSLTISDLIKGCKLAIKARKKPVRVGRFSRLYSQVAHMVPNRKVSNPWDCGTACCIHGFAHLSRFKRPTKGGPQRKDYNDLGEDLGYTVRDYLSWPSSKPEYLLCKIREGTRQR